ncbi:MAG: pseudouridine synthase [Cryomorphaceae bacterium BACL11 MAG-121001-bin54]|jgi:tRNA pseudouridine55 synthase|nr:MAG: pseudouridine synthase [Cryomorphaceae bacterium BACL11 MAG-121001-bin54]MBC8301130.1 tRNA pseudouridine(55) synthase TruB [Pelagibacterales bacterium]
MTSEDYLAGQMVLIDKPLGWSSFDVVKKIKHLISKKYNLKKLKVGHAGTLDPLATGLLIVCTGKFTKRISEIQGQEKTYTGTITLGGTTPSYDLETEVDNNYKTSHITKELIHQTTKQFIGEIDQKPPIFSALKKGGERLYEKARRGEEIIIESRKIFVREFNIISIENLTVAFEIKCSKGTYIRSIANDFGAALNSGGYLSSLCRTAIGDYQLSKGIDIESFEKLLNK